MIVLGLDTTGSDCSACIIRGDEVLAHVSEAIGRGHAERLAPMVMEIMTAAAIAPEQIDRVVVCTGPGSFTGLRVALSYAKGFALPRRKPVLGIDALHVKANHILQTQNDKLVTVFRDVKRGQVFAAQYSHGAPIEPPKAMTFEDAKALANLLQTGLYEAERCDVRVLAQMAINAEPSDYPAEPLYARAPDAKLPGGKSLPRS
jgi:tRNA threonylcarbamoyl adenosine modification protein YeaZ